MSHFSVLVITDDHGEGLEDEVTRLLEPYDENGTWFAEGSHWDWWVIGGRWTGHLDPAYDPYADERNYSTCKYCEGTGVTTQAVGDEYPAYLENVGKPCRQCAVEWSGEPRPFPGRMLNYQLVGHDADRGVPVEDVLDKGVEPTFAVVTPDGEWLQKGEMGWWGMASDVKDEWPAEWRSTLEQYRDKFATIVDCHV